MFRGGLLGLAAVIATACALAGCSSGVESIVSDDAAFCRYAAEAGTSTYDQCKSRLDGRHRQFAAASAVRIEGYALLNTPLSADVEATGSIKRDQQK